MTPSTMKKLVMVGSLASTALTLYVLFGDHNWFGDRQALRFDVAELARAEDGQAVFRRFPELPLRCAVERSALGAQACWSEIASYNDIPARSVTFYFDGQQRLTGWKLVTRAEHHQALRAHFEQRYGALAQTEQAGVLSAAVAGGTLAMPAQAPGDDTEALWLLKPAAAAR